MKRPQKLAVMLVPTPPYEICGLVVKKPISLLMMPVLLPSVKVQPAAAGGERLTQG